MTSAVLMIAGTVLAFVGAFVAAWPGLASKKEAAERALAHPIHAAVVVHEALIEQRKYAFGGLAIAAAGLALAFLGFLV